MTVNEAMLIVAEEVANKLGYIDTGKTVITGKRDWFWGNRVAAADKQIVSCKYILPQWEGERDDRKRNPKIEIDMHWGNPRLGIDYPGGTFCCLTYKGEKVSEAQAFGENGLLCAISIKQRIDKLINP